MKLLSNPTVRLIGRALVAGVVAALLMLQTADDWASVWKGAVVAGVLAACEILTPLNPTVGAFKN